MNLKPDLICEKCGSPAEPRQEGSTSGIYCTKCDWAVVTTTWSEIKRDQTKYKVYVVSGDPQSELQIRTVASIAGVNFIGAKKLLQQVEALVFDGRAPKVLEVRSELERSGISCKIQPEFKY